MTSRSTYLALATTATVAALGSTAQANPEVVRDHRDEPAVHYRHRPGPRFMMPLEIDLGAAGAQTDRGFAPGMEASVGIHWASLSPRPTDLDIGVGVFGAILGAPTANSASGAMTDSNNSVAYGGAYLQVGHTLAKGDWWRTWLSGRGEYLASEAFGKDQTGFGVSARLSAELFASGVGIEPRGVFLGTYALGVYAEVGMRDVAPGMSAVQATTGITIRTPLVFGR
jgi:hypothetical protein